ncbi:MAG: hypothetical protein RLZ35_293 [Pseudomonadota bacterium]|jgi:predicted DNA binding CopG/RHH family protein
MKIKKNKENKSVFSSLDDDEKALEEMISEDNFESISDYQKEKKHLMDVAKKTMKKNARVNIRLSSSDLLSIKVKAAYEGIPYQTLIASILHKYAAGHSMRGLRKSQTDIHTSSNRRPNKSDGNDFLSQA